MKITFVVPSLGLGGGVRVVFEYANRLTDRGHEVSIVHPLIPSNRKPGFSMVSSIKRMGSAALNLMRGNNVDWFDVKAKLVRIPTINPSAILNTEHLVPDADVIIATAWETAYFVNNLDNRKGKKFYFIQHYEIWDIWNDDRCWELAEKIETDPNKLCLAMHDIHPEDEYLQKFKTLVDATYTMPLHKITISSWLKELIENKFGEEVKATILNGINTEIFYNNKMMSKNNITVLMPYRPIIWKGTADGMKALEIVKKMHPETEIHLYGSKKDKNVPIWAVFHEKPTDEDLRALYSSSDIFIFPSLVEGYGLPPMEAMACGCAVVATNVGGVPDYAIDGKTILASPPRRPEILAKNIMRLIENEDERSSIAKSGYEYIQQYTWERATDQFEDALKNA
jgi:glycosyltransferase involved in cell wall biosynthesis